MENNTSANMIQDQTEVVGTLQIADEVVGMIAALAAAEVEGVALHGGSSSENLQKSAARKMLKNVKVDVAGDNVSVDLSIAINYGSQIPQTCANVQAKVKSAIETMTGLNVSDVNVRVAKVNMQ